VPRWLGFLLEYLVEGLVGADAPGLADVEARVTVCDRRRRRGDGVDVLLRDGVAALHVPLHERGVAVGRDLIAMCGIERRTKVLDRLEGLDGALDVRDR